MTTMGSIHVHSNLNSTGTGTATCSSHSGTAYMRAISEDLELKLVSFQGNCKQMGVTRSNSTCIHMAMHFRLVPQKGGGVTFKKKMNLECFFF